MEESLRSLDLPSRRRSETLPGRRLARLVRQPRTYVVPLDKVDATNVGRLLAASGTSDIADAHVVVCGRRARQTIVTSDPDDLRALDPSIDLITV